MQNYQLAIEDYSKAIEIDPEDQELHLLRADLYKDLAL